MNKLQQVSSVIIISTLFVSNIVLADQYKIDTDKSEKKIHNQKELIKSNEHKYSKSLSNKQGIINQQQKDINSKNQQINDLSNQLNQIKSENENLKKKLQ